MNMRKILNLAIVGLGLSVALSSCTIEKRRHMTGYHLEWHNSKDKTKQVEHSNVTVEDAPILVAETPAVEAPVMVQEPTAAVTTTQASVSVPSNEVEVTADAGSGVNEVKESVLSRMTRQHADRIEVLSTGAELAAAAGTFTMSNKQAKKLRAAGSATSSKWFKLWLICWGAAILFTILAVALISPAIWVVGALAWLAGSVFFILWLIEVLG